MSVLDTHPPPGAKVIFSCPNCKREFSNQISCMEGSMDIPPDPFSTGTKVVKAKGRGKGTKGVVIGNVIKSKNGKHEHYRELTIETNEGELKINIGFDCGTSGWQEE